MERNPLKAAALLLLVVLPLPAIGQPLAAPAAEGPNEPPAPACEDGVVKDDGTVETGFGWVPSVIEGEYVQVFNSSEFSARKLATVCVCWLRTTSDRDIDFEVVFYRSVPLSEPVGGITEIPADLPYAAVPATAVDVPQGIVGKFYDVDVDVEIPPGVSYIGVRWDASLDQFFFVCADSTRTTPVTNVFFRDDRAEGWDSVLLSPDPIFDEHRAIMVRARPNLLTVVDVPALGAWGLAALAALLAAAGARRLRRAR